MYHTIRGINRLISVFLRSLVARFGIHTTAQLLARVYSSFNNFSFALVGKIADDRVSCR